MPTFLIKIFKRNTMNKNLLNIFLFVLVLFTSCLKEQNELFSDPAAVRLNNTLSGIDSSLTNAPNGWIMQYFATSESPGYSMLIRFNINREVVVATKNELVNYSYTEAKSLFSVIGDNGPVLTFNTYNNVLHLFSNPVNPDGTGLNGDYEFVVLNHSDSTINLKGKKRGTAILMQRLSAGVSWVDYLDGLNKIDNDFFAVEPLYFVSGKDTSAAFNGASHIFDLFSFVTGEIKSISFIVTSNGLKFYSPFTTDNDKTVQSFSLSSDGNKLISNEDVNTFFVGTAISTYFESSHETFVIDTTRMSDHFRVPVRTLCQQMNDKFGGKRNVDYLAISYKTGFGHSFFLATKPTITLANFGIELLPDQSPNNVITINKSDGVYDSNGSIFISSVPAIDEVWQKLEGTYRLTSNVSKKEIKFVDKNDATRFFVVIKK
jgi:hypothetical protein